MPDEDKRRKAEPAKKFREVFDVNNLNSLGRREKGNNMKKLIEQERIVKEPSDALVDDVDDDIPRKGRKFTIMIHRNQ